MAEFISQRGLTWHYEVSGTGETIVFIHGFGASSGWWHYQQNFLAGDFQVITLDLPGHGHSDWMPLGLNEMAQDIGQLINSLGDVNFSMVASSFGGLVASEIYRHMPDRVMRISFVGSIPKFARSENYPAGLDIDKIRKLSQQINTAHSLVMDIFFRSLFTMKERESERFKQIKILRATQGLPSEIVLQHYLKLLEETDLRDRVSKIICPLQYITGSEDYICPESIMTWLSEHTYNARYDTIKGCGHLPFLTEVQEYNRLLEDFILN